MLDFLNIMLEFLNVILTKPLGLSYNQKNIDERNKRVLAGIGGSDYYLDEGLMTKLISKWEEPKREEIDIWYKLVW